MGSLEFYIDKEDPIEIKNLVVDSAFNACKDIGYGDIIVKHVKSKGKEKIKVNITAIDTNALYNIYYNGMDFGCSVDYIMLSKDYHLLVCEFLDQLIKHGFEVDFDDEYYVSGNSKETRDISKLMFNSFFGKSIGIRTIIFPGKLDQSSIPPQIKNLMDDIIDSLENDFEVDTEIHDYSNKKKKHFEKTVIDLSGAKLLGYAKKGYYTNVKTTKVKKNE